MAKVRKHHPDRHRLVQKMRDIVEAKGLKYTSLWRESGMSSHTLNYWSNGKRSPNIVRFEKMLKVIGCKLAIVPDA